MARRAGYASKRDSIIEAALGVLGDQGYDALTVDEVIATAGISKGTFYHYFETKDALVEASLLAMADTVASEVTGAARLGEARTGCEDGDPEAWLEPLVTLVRPWRRDDDAGRRAAALTLLSTPSLEALRTRMFSILTQRLTPSVTEVIDAGARAGRFRVTDPPVTAELLVLLTLSARARVITLAAGARATEAGATGARATGQAATPQPAAEPGWAAEAARWIGGYLTVVERTLGLADATFARDDEESVLQAVAGRTV